MRRSPEVGTGIDDHASLTAVAFGTLLNATRAGLAAPQAGGAATSPAQMFEASATDAHEHRQSVLKEQDRASLLSSDDARRLDSTSVDARGTLGEKDEAKLPTPRLPGATPDMASKVNSGKLADLVQGSGGDRGVDSRLTSELSAGAARAAVDVPGSATNIRSEQPPRADGETRIGPGVVPPAAAMGAASSATLGQSQPESTSQQVGRLLGAAKTGEAESPRAVASSPANDGARQSGGKSQTTLRSAEGRRPQTSRSAHQTDETRSSRQSQFDRLVRSIRLNAGMKNSSARLQLQPPELGRIRVDVRMIASTGDSPEQIQIDVRTETAKARELLYERSALLKEALEHHGIRVERFDVTHDTHAHERDDHVGGNDSRADVDRWHRKKEADSPAQHETTASDDPGASETAALEPEAIAGAEARLDIRI